MNTNETQSSRLRRLLREPGIIVAPGAYDCLTARIIQQAGFPAVYMTGAGTSVAALGYPDLGLATMIVRALKKTKQVSEIQNHQKIIPKPQFPELQH